MEVILPLKTYVEEDGGNLNLRDTLKLVYGVQNTMSTPRMYLHDDDCFMFKFKSESDKEKVLEKGFMPFKQIFGPSGEWLFDFDFRNDPMRFIPLRLILPGTPVQCWVENNLEYKQYSASSNNDAYRKARKLFMRTELTMRGSKNCLNCNSLITRLKNAKKDGIGHDIPGQKNKTATLKMGTHQSLYWYELIGQQIHHSQRLSKGSPSTTIL
ncbi:hypothetical protein P3L10_010056 [Capsicum annuum]